MNSCDIIPSIIEIVHETVEALNVASFNFFPRLLNKDALEQNQNIDAAFMTPAPTFQQLQRTAAE